MKGVCCVGRHWSDWGQRCWAACVCFAAKAYKQTVTAMYLETKGSLSFYNEINEINECSGEWWKCEVQRKEE